MENNTNVGDTHAQCSGKHEVMRRAFGILAGKWKLEILWHLHQRTHRFGELRRSIPGITQHMLTAQLRDLEREGLVSRVVYAEVPPRVEYSITDKALALAPVMDALMVWAEHYQT